MGLQRIWNDWATFTLDKQLWNSFKCTVQFSLSVMSHSLQTHGLQQTWLPCSSPAPEAGLNSCPLSQWCHPTISSSVVPFSSCLQSFQASESFPMSHFFTSGGQSIVASATISALPMNIQDWFPLGLTGLISLQSKGLSSIFSNTTIQKHQFLMLSFFCSPTVLHITIGKAIALTMHTFVSQMKFVIFNMLSLS